MAAFADLDEYQTVIQQSLEGVELAAAEFQLDAATEDIRDYLNQYVELVESDEVTLQGTGTRALLLPEAPVVTINSVTVDDELLDVDYYTVDTDAAILYRVGWRVWPAHEEIVVDYDHGYETIPANIKSACIELAMLGVYRGTRDPALQSETVGPFSYTLAVAQEKRRDILATLAKRVLPRNPVA